MKLQWTPAEDDQVRALYPTMKVNELATMLKRTPRAVGARAQHLGVQSAKPGPRWVPLGTERWEKRRQVMLRKVADTGEQSKDWRPVCVVEWEAINGPVPEGMMLCAKDKRLPRTLTNLVLMSKKDLQRTMSTKPLGSETVRPMDGRLYRKVALTGEFKQDWKRVDILEWEKVHGTIPEGYRLGLTDMKGPDTLDNQALFTEAEYYERMNIKGVPSFPKEVRELVHLKAAITKQVKKLAQQPT